MHASRKRSRGNVLDTLLEKGIICIALAVVLLMAPHVLKGGTVVINTVVATVSPFGWVALVLGLLLIALHLLVLRLRRNLPDSAYEEARASRFQHSVLPEELLNPPTRIRLEPLPLDSPLRDPRLGPKLRKYPHFASAAKATRLSTDPEVGMAGRCVQALIDVIEGNYGGDPAKMPYVVNKEAFSE